MITFVALPFQMLRPDRLDARGRRAGDLRVRADPGIALVSGALADAFDRRLLVVFCRAGLGGVHGGAARATRCSTSRMRGCCSSCAAVLAGFYALLRPPLDSLVPRVVPREQLKAAMALEWVRGNVGMIAGPAIGGVLIAAFGVPLTYGDRPRDVPDLARLPGADAGDARRRPTPTRRACARSTRACATRAAGRSCSAPTSSTSTRCCSACRRRSSRRSPRATAAPGCWGCCCRARGRLAGRRPVQRLDAARAPPRPRGGAGGVRLGRGDRRLRLHRTCCGWRWPAWRWRARWTRSRGLFRSVIWNETIPDRLRGRLAGVEMISYTSGPTLGNFEAGALASLTSVRTSVVSGGVLCVAGTAVLVALLLRPSGATTPAAAAPSTRLSSSSTVDDQHALVAELDGAADAGGTTSEPRSLPVRASSTISSSPCSRTSAEEAVQAVPAWRSRTPRARGRHLRRRSPAKPARAARSSRLAESTAVSCLAAARGRRSPPAVAGGIRLCAASCGGLSVAPVEVSAAESQLVASPTMVLQPVRADVMRRRAGNDLDAAPPVTELRLQQARGLARRRRLFERGRHPPVARRRQPGRVLVGSDTGVRSPGRGAARRLVPSSGTGAGSV